MTPYATYVTGHDPLDVLRTTLTGYREVFTRNTPASWARPWAPGKWTAHQVLVHVTQWELIFSTRIRTALAIPNYVVQPMDQDDLLDIEAPAVDAAMAAAAFEAVRRMNIALVAALTPAQQQEIQQFLMGENQKFLDEIQPARDAKMQEVETDIMAVVKKMSEAKGYSLVLDNAVVLFGGDDITELVISEIKKNNP